MSGIDEQLYFSALKEAEFYRVAFGKKMLEESGLSAKLAAAEKQRDEALAAQHNYCKMCGSECTRGKHKSETEKLSAIEDDLREKLKEAAMVRDEAIEKTGYLDKSLQFERAVAQAAIKERDEAMAELAKRNWIAFSDRKPEPGQMVMLICADSGHPERTMMLSFVSPFDQGWEGNPGSYTHWMIPFIPDQYGPKYEELKPSDRSEFEHL